MPIGLCSIDFPDAHPSSGVQGDSEGVLGAISNLSSALKAADVVAATTAATLDVERERSKDQAETASPFGFGL